MGRIINVNAENQHPGTKEIFMNLIDDLALIKTQLAVLTAKLDADAGVTDVNYGTLVSVPLVYQTKK